jgi:hypothetical protein
MNHPNAGNIQNAFGKLVTLTAALGSQLPGISFFIGLTPPNFRVITLLISGGTIAVFVRVFNQPRDKQRHVKCGVWSIVIAVFVAAIYVGLFQFLTVGTPAGRGGDQRFQIGFGMYSFSLTDNAQRVAQQNHLETKEDLMLALGGYEQGTFQIWKPWSIVIAAIILWVVFVASYVFWASGLAHIARSLK